MTVRFLDRQLARDNLYVQFKLGRMLFRGELYPANTALGLRLLAGLAERQYAPACWLLAADYYRGAYGLPKRPDVANYYSQRAMNRPKLARTLRKEPATVIRFDRLYRQGPGA